MAYSRKRQKSKKTGKAKKSGIDWLFSFLTVLTIIFGLIIIPNQVAKRYQSDKKYQQQISELQTAREKAEELMQDKENLKNPEMFEEIARKNGYRFENETVVNVTSPITEEDKWK